MGGKQSVAVHYHPRGRFETNHQALANRAILRQDRLFRNLRQWKDRVKFGPIRAQYLDITPCQSQIAQHAQRFHFLGLFLSDTKHLP